MEKTNNRNDNQHQDIQTLHLPILNHFDNQSLTPMSQVDQKWRGGEKGMMAFLAALGIGAVGVFSWTYILPSLFSALSEMFAFGITAFAIVTLVLASPVLYKGLKRFTRALHELLIRHDPFGELEEQLQKMRDNQEKFKDAKKKIKVLKTNMESESVKAEKEVEDYKEQVISLQGEATKLKGKLENLERKLGVAAKEQDEYVEYQSQLMKTLSEADRVSHLLQQSTSFVQKYGARANVMGKLDRKLAMVETALDIKVSDFDASIAMLRKEYAFAQASKDATEQARSVMMFDGGWELDYAMDVVTGTIAKDIALTQENLSDIDLLTSQYSLNNDELYAKLDSLADRIKTGDYETPTAKQYKNPNYKLTDDDKANSGGFGDLF